MAKHCLYRKGSEAGYVTVLLALVCCLIAGILVIFAESARQISDREVAQVITDEASLLAVEQLDEEMFLTQSVLALDKSQARNVVVDLIQDKSRETDVRLSLVSFSATDNRVDLEVAFGSDKLVGLETEFDNIVRSSAEIGVVNSE